MKCVHCNKSMRQEDLTPSHGRLVKDNFLCTVECIHCHKDIVVKQVMGFSPFGYDDRRESVKVVSNGI